MTIAYNKKSQTLRRRALRHSMSKAEVILWSKLSRKQMNCYKFRRQYSVDQYILDFYCPRLKLAIEVDGDSHFVLGIEAFGIQFIRVTNDDVCNNIDGVCQKIFNTIETLQKQNSI